MTQARAQRILYAGLLLLRLLLALTTHGYIHPDEHFQSTEGALTDGYKTWEFNPAFPCRSMASVRLWNAPVVLAQWALSSGPVSLWYITRLTYFALSLIGDVAIVRLAGSKRIQLQLLLVYASSGSVLTLGVRAFSNNVEAALLWICFVCVEIISRGTKTSRPHKVSSAWRWHLTLGTLISLGVFARFTFAIFAAPLGVWYLYLLWSTTRTASTRKALQLVTPTLIGFSITSSAHVLYDTLYYSSSTGHTLTWVITPLNALRYNAQTANLAQHGLHPRWLHVVVNAPMILGLAVYFLVAVGVIVASCSSYFSRATSHSTRTNILTLTTSLAILSTQPHQEPRFLYPLIVPALFLLPRNLGRWFVSLHVLQSALMVLFFGVAHQAGVTPALLWISSGSSDQSVHTGQIIKTVHSRRTFMPPRHLLVQDEYRLVDHGSASAQHVMDSVNTAASDNGEDDHLLVAPTWALNTLNQDCLNTLYTTWPHLDTDHLGEMLDVYRACVLVHKRKDNDGNAYGLCAKEALGLKVVKVSRQCEGRGWNGMGLV